MEYTLNCILTKNRKTGGLPQDHLAQRDAFLAVLLLPDGALISAGFPDADTKMAAEVHVDQGVPGKQMYFYIHSSPGDTEQTREYL